MIIERRKRKEKEKKKRKKGKGNRFLVQRRGGQKTRTTEYDCPEPNIV